jgi:hypothetical protein
MSMNSSQADFQKNLDGVAGILVRCFLGGMGLLMVWFAMFALCGDSAGAHYAVMAATKIAIVLFFLLPWIAIKLVSQKRDT